MKPSSKFRWCRTEMTAIVKTKSSKKKRQRQKQRQSDRGRRVLEKMVSVIAVVLLYPVHMFVLSVCKSKPSHSGRECCKESSMAVLHRVHKHAPHSGSEEPAQ